MAGSVVISAYSKGVQSPDAERVVSCEAYNRRVSGLPADLGTVTKPDKSPTESASPPSAELVHLIFFKFPGPYANHHPLCDVHTLAELET